MGNPYGDSLPDDIFPYIGKTIERTLPDGRKIKFVLGDVTGDGKIDEDDIEILRLLVKQDSTSDALFSTMSAQQIAACDVTGDGLVNQQDLVDLAKKLINNQDTASEVAKDPRLQSLRERLRR